MEEEPCDFFDVEIMVKVLKQVIQLFFLVYATNTHFLDLLIALFRAEFTYKRFITEIVLFVGLILIKSFDLAPLWDSTPLLAISYPNESPFHFTRQVVGNSNFCS